MTPRHVAGLSAGFDFAFQERAFFYAGATQTARELPRGQPARTILLCFHLLPAGRWGLKQRMMASKVPPRLSPQSQGAHIRSSGFLFKSFELPSVRQFFRNSLFASESSRLLSAT